MWIMELKTWKQLPSDTFTCVEVPSFKMMEIMLLNGAREAGTISSRDFLHWIVQIPDDRKDSTFAIIRDLRVKGMKFDGIEPE
jgi:hypothetical protein